MVDIHGQETPVAAGAERDRPRAVASVDDPRASGGEARVAGVQDDGGAPADDARLMAAFGVRRTGRFYLCRGYCYTRVDDAVAYARRVCERPELARQEARMASNGAVAVRADAQVHEAGEASLMALWQITWCKGQYAYGGFCYDRLHDAAAYARLERSM